MSTVRMWKILLQNQKVFEEKHIEEENITDYLDAEDGAFQDILEKIANKISEKNSNCCQRKQINKIVTIASLFL